MSKKEKKTKSLYKKVDKKNFLYIIPILVLGLILSFQIAYFIFESNITNEIINIMKSENGITDDVIISINKFIETYDNHFISLGLEIIGIAISVWIGLNIYNIIKRDSIKELETVAKQTQIELNEFSNNYKQFNITAIENAHIPEDRINTYYINEFTQKYSNILNYKLTKYIVFFERSFESIINSYNNNNSDLMKNNLAKLENEINLFKKEINYKNNTLNTDEWNFIQSYITCRIADYNYYCGLYHKSIKEYKSAHSFLCKAKDNYLNVIIKYKIDDQTAKIYINNVLGYIYQLFYNICDDKNVQEKKENAKKAFEYSKKACFDENGNDLNTGYVRDYRNYGVNIENYIKYYEKDNDEYIMNLFNAYNQYLTAYRLKKNDIKTLTCLSSCILKIFDRIIEIHDDKNDNYKNLSILDTNIINKKLNELEVNYNSDQLIDAANKYLLLAFHIDNTSVAAHYHMIHVYMYEYLLSNNDIYKEKGLKEIENVIALSFGKNSPKSFKYKARNFYYAIGDNANAELYNAEL